MHSLPEHCTCNNFTSSHAICTCMQRKKRRILLEDISVQTLQNTSQVSFISLLSFSCPSCAYMLTILIHLAECHIIPATKRGRPMTNPPPHRSTHPTTINQTSPFFNEYCAIVNGLFDMHKKQVSVFNLLEDMMPMGVQDIHGHLCLMPYEEVRQDVLLLCFSLALNICVSPYTGNSFKAHKCGGMSRLVGTTHAPNDDY